MSEIKASTLSDEEQIRAVIEAWLQASRAGDLPTLLNLMTEDVIFLTPGNKPMRRDDFSNAFKAMSGAIAIEGHPDVQEITITGDLAVCWNFLDIKIIPQAGGNSMRRLGNILTVFRRGADRQWRIWRDANMLTSL